MAMAQSEISEYTPGATAEGAIYFLPKTALRITVKVGKSTYTPGDFCKYAKRYLRLNDVEQQQSTTYRVVTLGLTSFGMADKKKAYSVKYNTKSVAANFVLADDGTLQAINIGTSAVGTKSALSPNVTDNSSNFTSEKTVRDDPRKYLSEEILSAGSTAKMAELTAREIYEIRDSKNQLNRGEADFMPKDGEQLRIMLANLDRQEQALMGMFTGATVRDTTEHEFVVCPESEIKRDVLFRLSKQLGLVAKDDLSGVPYYIKVEDLHSLPAADTTETEAAKKKKAPESGIYVNVPGKIRVTVSKGDTTMGTFELYAAQFGNVELLSGDLFNKRATTQLTLNPVTGSVERLQAELPK